MSFYTISHWEADEWIDEMEAIIAAALSFEFVSSRAISQQKILVGWISWLRVLKIRQRILSINHAAVFWSNISKLT